MKTAKGTLDRLLQPISYLDKIKLIKEYGHECAQQALNDAAENAKINVDALFGHSFTVKLYCDGDRDTISVDKESITRTEIKTP